MNQKKIGEFIAKKRKNKNLTQANLAEKLGVTNRTIINWENGKCLPDYSLLIPLSNELDISISELLTGEKDKEQKTTAEMIINYLDRNRKQNLKERELIGKILLIGGILLSIFTVIFIKPINTGDNIYPIIGMLFALCGFSYINKKHTFKKRILLNLLFTVVYIVLLIGYDIYDIHINNNIPRYYTGGISETDFKYFETPFYDVYRCFDKDNKFHIIPIETKFRNGDLYLPSRQDYCGE